MARGALQSWPDRCFQPRFPPTFPNTFWERSSLPALAPHLTPPAWDDVPFPMTTRQKGFLSCKVQLRLVSANPYSCPLGCQIASVPFYR